MTAFHMLICLALQVLVSSSEERLEKVHLSQIVLRNVSNVRSTMRKCKILYFAPTASECESIKTALSVVLLFT